MAPFMVVFLYISRVIFWSFTEDDSEIHKSIYSMSLENFVRVTSPRAARPRLFRLTQHPQQSAAHSPAHCNFIWKSSLRIKTLSLAEIEPRISTMIVLRTGTLPQTQLSSCRYFRWNLLFGWKVVVWGKIHEPVQQFLSMKVPGRDSELRSH